MNKTRTSALATSSQHYTGGSTQGILSKIETKVFQTGQIEKSQGIHILLPKILLGLINEFSKSEGYKINIQKSVLFPCNSNLKRKIKKSISFIILSQRIK